jgi:F420-dependent oxidoreductase-like protein
MGAHTTTLRLGTGIMQMHARTPASTAMTAMTLDQLSGGRFVLGLGVSGPQVVEGWHGVSYGKPLARTREYIAILRKIFAREAPLEYQGEYFTVPYTGEDASGLGKPLKSIVHGRQDLPIFIAAIGPKNVSLAAEIADGWIPVFFAPEHFGVFSEHVQEGFSKAGGGKGHEDFTIAPYVSVVMGEDTQACRDAVRPQIALYVGGMGARGQNFYNKLVRRYGYEEEADTIQNLYLSGKKEEAAAAIPDDLVDKVALCGPRERIAERLEPWRKIPNLILNVGAHDSDTLRVMAELVL